MSYILTVDADASNLPMIKLIPRSGICFVIMIAHTNFFKILTTYEYLFFSILFFVVLALFATSIAVFGTTKKASIAKVGAELSLTDLHSPKQTFLGVAYFFSFLILRYNIRFTGSLDGFLVNDDKFVQVAKTYIPSIDMSKKHILYLKDRGWIRVFQFTIFVH